jgi:hypothetical protein
MAKKTNLPELLIYPARWRVLVNVVLYAAFIFTGLLLVAETAPMPRIIGAAVVVYFGILEIYALWRLAVRAPSLIVGPEGIYDNTAITGVGGIHWHEITSIAQKKNYLVRHIALELRDRDAVIERVPAPRRWLIGMMSFIAQGSVNLTPGFLERDLTEVEALLQQYHAEFGPKR